MSRYLLASDFDNTICFWSDVGRIYDEDREAIRRFREEGNIFVVISGRSYPSALEVFSEMDFHDMDMCALMSGAYWEYPDKRVAFDMRVETEKLVPLCDFFRETKAGYLVVDIGQRSISVDIGGNDQPEGTVSFEELLSTEKTFTSINVGYETREMANTASKELEKRFSHIITPLQNNRAVDMPPAGMDKAVAVGLIAEKYGIDKNNIYTVGDNYNDIQMLSAYHGNAMANGPKEVWASAKRKVSHVSEVIDYILSQGKKEK